MDSNLLIRAHLAEQLLYGPLGMWEMANRLFPCPIQLSLFSDQVQTLVNLVRESCNTLAPLLGGKYELNPSPYSIHVLLTQVPGKAHGCGLSGFFLASTLPVENMIEALLPSLFRANHIEALVEARKVSWWEWQHSSLNVMFPLSLAHR